MQALRDVDFEARAGEFIVILGPSGSGKSTFLNIIGGLDTATSGDAWFMDHALTRQNEAALTRYRRDHVGFIFQFYNLVPSLTARENVKLVTEIARNPMKPEEALALVGLEDRMDHFPAQLSGGEQQRVAIARAIAKRPDVLLCDEPTGALDSKTGIRVLEALTRVNAETGATTLVITHNAAIAAIADRVVNFANGTIASEQRQRVAQAAIGGELVIRALDIKLLRDLERLWPQALAIALVMAAGVATLILGVGAHDSLATTRERYYETNRFADVFASLTRAPEALKPDIAAIDGVAAVETRIEKIALADIPGMAEPASVLLVSLPDYREQALNRIYLRTGTAARRRDGRRGRGECGLRASAHGLREGSTIRVLINGRQRDLRISGTALSPEFVYALGPGALMPDERRFGILWMPERALAAAYDLDGAFNAVSLQARPGQQADNVIAALDRLLDRYGGLGGYARKDQQSHAFLDAELQQLRAMSRILPPIFLLVSAFLVNMTLSRLIALEREQIGLLKAMGYSSLAVVRHYVGFVSLIALLGIAHRHRGGHLARRGHDEALCQVLQLSLPGVQPEPRCLRDCSGGDLCSGHTGRGEGGARGGMALARRRHVAAGPAALPQGAGRAVDLSRVVRQSSVIVMRHLTHWPMRTASGILGMALAVAILVGSLWSFGSIDHMIDVTFRSSDRQDATINFTAVKPLSALFEARRLARRACRRNPTARWR